jgi:hypothetical protein
MSVEAGPPPGAPMLSPDGKWVWDGSRWLPIADPSTANHHAVFAAWNGARVEAPVAPEPAPVAPVHRQVAAPVETYAVPTPEPEPVPLWRQQAETGLNKYLYIAAGVIAVIVLAVAVNSFGLSLPWMQTTSSSPKAAPGPPPLTKRSEYARADRFINGLLAPAMNDMNQRIQVARETCVGPMTISCQEAITETDNQAQNMLPMIDHETMPFCIATPVTRVRADLSKTHDALQATLKGFADNNSTEFKQSLSRFGGAVQVLQADVAAVSAAESMCDTQLVGP